MKRSQIKKLIPKLPDLKKAHKDVITADVADRVNALRKVMDWLDVYTALVRSQVVAAGGQRKLDLVAKIKPLAERTDTPNHEAENALLGAIRMLETALVPVLPKLNLPRINDTYTTFETKKTALEASANRATAKFTTLKAELDQFFGSFGLTFTFKKDLSQPRQFDASGRVMYSFTYGEQLVAELKASGPASVLLGQAPSILKAASIVVTSGQASISVARLMTMLPNLLTSVHELGATAHRPATGPPTPAPTVATPAPACAPPPPQAPPTTPKPPRTAPAQPPAGLSAEAAKYFRTGTQQILFDRLVKANGSLTMSTLYQGLSAGDPKRMVLSIHQKGVKLGKWTAERQGKMVYFVWTGGSHV
jgi:hypothetical protein